MTVFFELVVERHSLDAQNLGGPGDIAFRFLEHSKNVVFCDGFDGLFFFERRLDDILGEFNQVYGVVFGEDNSSLSFQRRSSGTSTIPTFRSMVQKG